MYVNEAMSSPVITCHPDTRLDDIARLMWDGDCGAIPVVDAANRPLGVVTDRDIAMAAMLNHQPLWNISASTVIQGQQPCCCTGEEALDDCLERMRSHGVRRILVTDADGKLDGILSMGDAIAVTDTHAAKRRNGRLRPEPMLEMLRMVACHHRAPEQPLAAP